MNTICRSSRTTVRNALLAGLCLILFLNGCVERKLFIKSDPMGAAVSVNGRHVGIAPVKVPFDTYGTFEIMASHPGHKRVRAPVEVSPPWWQYVPFDWFVEHVWPFTLRDEPEISLLLEPMGSAEDPGIGQRQEELRRRVETD